MPLWFLILFVWSFILSLWKLSVFCFTSMLPQFYDNLPNCWFFIVLCAGPLICLFNLIFFFLPFTTRKCYLFCLLYFPPILTALYVWKKFFLQGVGWVGWGDVGGVSDFLSSNTHLFVYFLFVFLFCFYFLEILSYSFLLNFLLISFRCEISENSSCVFSLSLFNSILSPFCSCYIC